MLTKGKKVMVLSAGALLPRPELIELAKAHGGQIIVPTGALLALDAVTAAAEGAICSVTMITRKPPKGLAGAHYLAKNAISVDGLKEPLRVFAGTAREAAAGFPENVNVVAALSLAGIGPDRTMIEIWADPSITRNCHTIKVDADSARFACDRERALGKSQDRPDHGAVSDGGVARNSPPRCGWDLALIGRCARVHDRREVRETLPTWLREIRAGLRRVFRRLHQLQRRDIARAIREKSPAP